MVKVSSGIFHPRSLVWMSRVGFQKQLNNWQEIDRESFGAQFNSEEMAFHSVKDLNLSFPNASITR